ncbi:Tvp23p KNAG_0H02900 [Huiozyma naganishii CBS 8797]|uniref:Golgi apparatus membrane protein TVP23 n=1 Tax=Huiozyma naganishii (strain ATCC MYA-139 / BCRC 22969 / CBS 8797 / KCTC 17520 / NBRC 10181 / NCYC 3082 / Yp74L-3) TaxID=1071383 RepID=J7RA02_HUIN7|nr:hypothetical protein KNAG_0H02900 [Kazachstania naganishii CBS 8797]CCK71705.1 hypothetical protein KNAG_0H02900 [Kazachstania naganishii CBS 8797]
MEQIRNFYETILKSTHPFTMAVHLAGKAAPIVFYIVGPLFLGFTAQFIIIILLVAFDFYVSKNISGRKLVQLRWWYDATNKNNSNFTFESHKQYTTGPPISAIDSKLFWWSMYLTPVVWFVFGILCLLKLRLFYLILVVMVVFLTGWNAYGFRCCDRWDPQTNSDGNEGNGTWFQLPNMLNLDNLSRISRVQSFFQGNGSTAT